MKPISALCQPLNDAENPPRNGRVSDKRATSSTSTNTELSDQAIVTLWTRMAAIYGHKWVSAHGDSDITRDTWQRGLKDLSTVELAVGLRAVVNRQNPWPPSLPEFRTLCKPPAPEPAHAIYRALPKPKANPEQATRALNAARKRMDQGLRYDPAERERILNELAQRPARP